MIKGDLLGPILILKILLYLIANCSYFYFLFPHCQNLPRISVYIDIQCREGYDSQEEDDGSQEDTAAPKLLQALNKSIIYSCYTYDESI